MKVEVYADDETMSARAAALVLEAIRRDPSLMLCAATGSTPTATYRRLALRRQQEPELFEQLRVVKLDEWGGLGVASPGSCEHYLRRHVLDPLGVGESRFLSFRGDAPDPVAECDRIREVLAAEGPVGVSVLGLGLNGHLGFIEPADALVPRAHVARLDAKTRRHPMLESVEHPPDWGLTLGIADIMRSTQVLLLVSGRHKRDILARLLSERVSTHLPASFLHLHANSVILADRGAFDSDADITPAA